MSNVTTFLPGPGALFGGLWSANMQAAGDYLQNRDKNAALNKLAYEDGASFAAAGLGKVGRELYAQMVHWLANWSDQHAH